VCACQRRLGGLVASARVVWWAWQGPRGSRRGKAWTQTELALEAGVGQSTVAQIESGVRPNPHPKTLGKLAEALDVKPGDLLPDED
jgi:transcriptional regulator with XRE-family HTH domain